MDRVICQRCHGLTYPIDPLALDVIQGGKLDDIRAWRRVTCGVLIDPIIVQNRSRPKHHRVRRRDSTPRQPVFMDPDLEWPVWR